MLPSSSNLCLISTSLPQSYLKITFNQPSALSPSYPNSRSIKSNRDSLWNENLSRQLCPHNMLLSISNIPEMCVVYPRKSTKINLVLEYLASLWHHFSRWRRQIEATIWHYISKSAQIYTLSPNFSKIMGTSPKAPQYSAANLQKIRSPGWTLEKYVVEHRVCFVLPVYLCSSLKNSLFRRNLWHPYRRELWLPCERWQAVARCLYTKVSGEVKGCGDSK